MSSKKDYYEILGVPKSANDTELKSAYRKKALEWHPDRNKSPEAESRFKEINEAYQVLSDKQKRSQYDQFGHAAFSQGAGGPGGGFGGFNQGPFTYTYSSSQNPFSNMDFGGFNDPFEIFEQFFGGSNPFRNTQNRKPHYSLTIPFMTAIHGGSEEVSIDGKKHTIKIPAGTDTGTRLKFSNFDITFEVSEHPTFKRDGLDIYTDHKISFSLAVLGGETKITTLDEPLIVKVRPGTQSGSMVRLSGKGVVNIRSLNKKDRGDLYVRFIIDVPKNISKKQKQLLEEFEKVSS